MLLNYGHMKVKHLKSFLNHLLWSRQWYLCGVWKKCYHSYYVLSATVKDCFVKVTQQNFHSAKMRLEISHDGNKGIREFLYAYCNICKRMSIKCYWSIRKEGLIGNWDILQISIELLDLLGCIIPDGSKEKGEYVGLNARKYLMAQCQYSAKFHKMKDTAPKTPGMM